MLLIVGVGWGVVMAYSVHDEYRWLREMGELEEEHGESWLWIWKMVVPEKLWFFIWLVLHDALPINSNRFRCQLALSPGCFRCSNTLEDVIHCLRDCLHLRERWGRLGAWSWTNFWLADYTA